MQNKLPTKFDWRFYLAAHPDLREAGILTKHAAEYHYVQHGVFEGRICCKTNTQSKQEDLFDNNYTKDQPIILTFQWYVDVARQKDIENALMLNIDNIYIDQIKIVVERENLAACTDFVNGLREGSGINIQTIRSRFTYTDWLLGVDANAINVLSNSDIYMDHTINLLRHIKNPSNKIYGITRKELNEEGVMVDSKDHVNGPTTNHLYSHDAWVVFGTPPQTVVDNVAKYKYELGIGNCDRLLAQTLNEEDNIDFENLYPHINAIHIDNRQERFRPHYSLIKSSKNEPSQLKDITKYIHVSDLQPNQNPRLEAIHVICTGPEIDNGYLQNLANMMSHTIRQYPSGSMRIAKKISIAISVLSGQQVPQPIIKTLEEIFKNVEIYNIDIPEEDNIYYNNISELLTYDIPRYGIKSGPNISFFDSMQNLSKYNTILNLECDVFLYDNWLYDFYQYTKYNYFWVAGSTYDGYITDTKITLTSDISQHINGGVALYNTGSIAFQKFMNFAFQYMPTHIDVTKKYNLAYDIYLWDLIYIGYNARTSEDHRIWSWLYKNYIKCNYICNFSDDRLHMSNEDIVYHYKAKCIHKKNPNIA